MNTSDDVAHGGTHPCTGDADCVGYDDEMHGWVVYAQPRNGEYTIIAGPFAESGKAREFCAAERDGARDMDREMDAIETAGNPEA